jgi:uncharacterized small protein (DUF1192 family)
MRKGLVAFSVIIGVVLLGATAVSYSKYRKYQADYNAATASQEDMRQRYDQAVGEIVSIQDSLSAIVLGNNGATVASTSSDVEMQPPQTLHDRGLQRIAELKSAIERTKARIEELDKNLRKSGVRIDNLERMVAGLRRSVKEKEERIAVLSTQVDTLQTQVAGLSETVDQKQHELATIFYAMGTKKELQTSGVLEAKGGVLGLGRTLKPAAGADEAAFTPLNTDEENVILIPAAKAQVVSAQPATSYELAARPDKTVELRILNPEEFRKIRHLVIVTTS